jgi:predicted nucleic acid-binding protein
VAHIKPSVSWLTGVEIVSALSRKVRARELVRRDAERIAALYREHVSQGHYNLLPLDGADIEWAAERIAKFDNSLRTLDALHLAIALREALALATADRALADAAKKLGMKVVLVR